MPPEAGQHNIHSGRAYHPDYQVMQNDFAVLHGGAPAVVTIPVVEERLARLAMSRRNRIIECDIEDRFDRKVLVAYQLNARSRIGLDVDGARLGFGGASMPDAVRIQYTLRIQPETPAKEKCRYPSAWQGIVGTGYNELFVREDETVWQELREIRRKTVNYIDDAF